MRRMMMVLVLAAAFVASGGGVAEAAGEVPRADCPSVLFKTANAERKKVVRKHGVRAAGRDIVRYGVRWRGRVRSAACHTVRVYRRQLIQLRTPPRYSTLTRTATPPGRAPAGVRSASVAAGGTLSSIAACESGGNPRAVSLTGRYRGKYQFDYGTWASVGGSGDPAAASEAEQDMRAAALYARRGAAPWPVCGYR